MKKKVIIAIVIIVLAAWFCGNVYWNYQASKEVGYVYHLAHANVRDGYMDDGDMAFVQRFVSRQQTIMRPVRAHKNLQNMRKNMLRIRRNAIDRERQCVSNGAYQALEVTKK